MLPVNGRWLDVVDHRIRNFRAPYLLLIQHHDVPAATRIVAPITPSLPGDLDVLAPRLRVGTEEYRVRMLDMSAVPRGLLGSVMGSAIADRDAIMRALDIILHGYPVGLPV